MNPPTPPGDPDQINVFALDDEQTETPRFGTPRLGTFEWVPRPPSMTVVPWNADQHLALSRQKIALRVLWTFVGVLVGGVVLIGLTRWTQLNLQIVKDLFLNVFTPMVGIVSGVLGFYYGTERARDKGTP